LPKEKFFDPRKPFQSQRPETHEEWQARMGGEVLTVVRSGLYLDFRFLDMALSALSPAPDERCRVLATDGQALFYQPPAAALSGQSKISQPVVSAHHIPLRIPTFVAERPPGAAAVEPCL
jgi:hypothetical protein